MRTIDLNADLGEGLNNDEELMKCISSANIACAAHAGDRNTMVKSVKLAIEAGVSIGAHISYPDKLNFGRVDLFDQLDLEDLQKSLINQMEILRQICEQFSVIMNHVKPHGALYNRAAKDIRVSDMVCDCIIAFDPQLILFGLSGSQMEKSAKNSGIYFVNEVFSDRSYESDGSLTPRNIPGAVHETVDLALKQALRIAKKSTVMSRQNTEVKLKAESICVHGDGKEAVNVAKSLVSMLQNENIRIEAPQFSKT
ncbi:MAG: LamB/YcsF family protein [Bacteroidetes bacterium]|nr:MAG: LamB/YcsF family protein [Bacteroidota bacterium]